MQTIDLTYLRGDISSLTFSIDGNHESDNLKFSIFNSPSDILTTPLTEINSENNGGNPGELTAAYVALHYVTTITLTPQSIYTSTKLNPLYYYILVSIDELDQETVLCAGNFALFGDIPEDNGGVTPINDEVLVIKSSNLSNNDIIQYIVNESESYIQGIQPDVLIYPFMDELSTKASIDYVDNLIIGIARKGAIIDFIDQATLDGLTPTAGDRYIIIDGTNINTIAEYNDMAWSYSFPSANWLVMNSTNDTDYTYDNDIVVAFKWAISGTKQIEKAKVEQFILTGTDITNKKVTLSNSPITTSSVIVFVIGGSAQYNTIDYSVNVNTKEVSWDTLGLEEILEIGDSIIINYYTYGD